MKNLVIKGFLPTFVLALVMVFAVSDINAQQNAKVDQMLKLEDGQY